MKIASESKIRDHFKAAFNCQPEFEIALESGIDCLKKASAPSSELPRIHLHPNVAAECF